MGVSWWMPGTSLMPGQLVNDCVSRAYHFSIKPYVSPRTKPRPVDHTYPQWRFFDTQSEYHAGDLRQQDAMGMHPNFLASLSSMYDVRVNFERVVGPWCAMCKSFFCVHKLDLFDLYHYFTRAEKFKPI